MAPISRALSVAVICTGFATVPEFLWRRDLRFRALTAAELVAQAFGYGAVAVAMALLGYGVWALVAGTVMRHAVFAAAVLAAGPRLPRPGLSRREAGELLGAVAGFSSVAAFNLIGNQGSRLVVARLLGATPLGYYTRATALSLALGPPRADRGQGALPRHGAAPAAHRPARRGVPARGRDPVVAGPSRGTAAGGVRRGGRGGGAGAQWTAAVPVLQILAIGTAFRIGGILNAPLARAMGALRPLAWRGAVKAALLVAGVAAGSRWGLNGVPARRSVRSSRRGGC